MTDAFEDDGVPADLAEAFGHPGALDPASEGGAGDASASSESNAGLAGLHAALDAEGPLDRVSGVSTPMRWALAAGLLLVFVAVVSATKGRADLEVYPRGRMLLDLLVLVVPLVLALQISLRPLWRPALPISRRILAVGVGLAGVGILVGMPMAHAVHPASLEGTGDMFVRRAAGCFSFGLSSAALATMGMGLLARNGTKRWLPGALGVWAAGLVGVIALFFHCPITHPEHLWAGHATVVLPVLAALWLVRRRLDG